MNLIILSSKVAWFGRQSGYDVLTDYIEPTIKKEIVQSGYSILGRIIGKFYQVIYKWNLINTQDVFTELKFLKKIKSNSVGHILHLESHVQITEKIAKRKNNLIGTIHLPVSHWTAEWLSALSKLDHAIILFEGEINAFSKYIAANNIHFIRHGINIDFFKPASSNIIIKNKVLIVGHFLRNFEMLLSVYQKIVDDSKNYFEFHVIIPSAYRKEPVLKEMAKNNKVFFYEKLSDQELLEQYQSSNILLIPMNDSGANSAIVQALAVGLPVLTTDVGGIRSYGGGDLYPVIKNNDVDGMVALFNNYAYNIEFRNSTSKKIRAFSEQYLDWEIIADQHLKLYGSIFSNIN